MVCGWLVGCLYGMCEKDILFVTYTKSIPLICNAVCVCALCIWDMCAPRAIFNAETNGISPKQMRATQTMAKHWFLATTAAAIAKPNVYRPMERLYLYLYTIFYMPLCLIWNNLTHFVHISLWLYTLNNTQFVVNRTFLLWFFLYVSWMYTE